MSPLLPLLQAAPPHEPRFYVYLAVAFVGLTAFFAVGLILFSRGWESYEEKYVEGTERTLESMFLTIPAQHLLYLRILSGFLSFFGLYGVAGSWLVALVGGLGASFLPDLALKIYKARRLKQFNLQLPDTLTMMTNALKSGFSLPKAFELVHRDAKAPTRQEFGILVQEMRLGVDTDEALGNLLERMPSPDLDLVITSMTISRDVGGNLTEVLETIAEVIRERTRVEGRIKSLTSQGKLQGYVVSALPVVMGFGLWLIDPSLMEPLFFTPVGWAILGAMFVFWTIGFFLIRKIAAIDV